ncbi:MAG: MATE family efflux transporter [Lachnospiraceae bacterium]|nr:MATE family efflux transporter [Lachnospiraceae bacterium]
MRAPGKTKDLTQGPIFRSLIAFAIPILLGTVITQLYNVADSVIVGKFVSDEALSAVSSTAPVHTIVNLFFISLSTGAVVIAHHMGAQDMAGVQKGVDTIGFLVIVCGLFVMIAGLSFGPSLLRALGTPEEILPDAVVYTNIIFIGTLGNLAYQMGSGILRNMGDSKWPFYFLVFCSVLNVVLDLAAVLLLHLGVFGVAAATAFSQFVSAIGVIFRINRGGYGVRISFRSLKPDREELKRVLTIGLPAAIQNIGNSIAAIFVQTSVNYFGQSMISANSVVTKLDDLINIPVIALSTAVCTFVGQNMGAFKMDRIKKGINLSILSLTLLGVFMIGFIQMTKGWLPRLFTDNQEVIAMASAGLSIMSFQCLFHGTDRVLVNAMRGAGKSVVPMVTAQFGAFTRIPLAYFLGVRTGRWEGIFYALLIAAFIRSAAIAVYYYCGGWKRAVERFAAQNGRR